MKQALRSLLGINGGKASAGSDVGMNALRIDLRGRLALVTGATGELGRVIARTLADCGADVAIQYHRQHETAAQLESDLRERGVRATALQADITDAASVDALKSQIGGVLGDPEIIVTTAVIQYAWTTVLNQSLEDYESQFRSCVLQNVIVAKAFAPRMIERRRGRIIALNTECAMQNHPTQSAYVAGKRGMDGLLRVLARELGEHQITVNQVAPGWMISESVRKAGSERQEFYEDRVPLRRRGEDQDVANLVAFLASDLASFITGAYISVSGGNVMPTI